LIAVTVAVGCGRLEPEFQYRETLGELNPNAQEAVRRTLVDRFGTPTDLRVWDALPLKHSGAVALVESVNRNKDGQVVSLQVWFPTADESDDPCWELWPIESGQQITFLDGEVKIGGDGPKVKSYESLPVDRDASPKGLISLASPISLEFSEGRNLRVATAPGSVLRQGRQLYAEHCQHCHGVSGDGAGPTAPYLNPAPRDYRKGTIKFTATARIPEELPPCRDDLARIIENGIPGTYMPSFKLLESNESDALVEYVRMLGMRGKTETYLYSQEGILKKESSTESMVAELQELLNDKDNVQTFITDGWLEAEKVDNIVLPIGPRVEPTPESIARGRELYLSAKVNCAKCHGVTGLGDGTQTRVVEKTQLRPGLYDDWNNHVTPRNLRAGIYRGGRRPLDIYRRIYSGVKGTPMNGFANLVQTDPETSESNDDDIWHLVNYVLALPHEKLIVGTGKVPEISTEEGAEATSEEIDTEPAPKTESPEPTETEPKQNAA